jgi:dGTP triphosphohydrolase
MRGVRMPPELEAKIDAWIERQPEPKPSRSEAIRRLTDMVSGMTDSFALKAAEKIARLQ